MTLPSVNPEPASWNDSVPLPFVVNTCPFVPSDVGYAILAPVILLVTLSVVALRSPTSKAAFAYPVPEALTVVDGSASRPSNSFQVESDASLNNPVYSVAPPSDRPSS